jgi:hypothetical protein
MYFPEKGTQPSLQHLLLNLGFKSQSQTGQWWCTPLVPALGRQRQADFCIRGQPGLQSEFKNSQGCTERNPVLGGKKERKKKKRKEKKKKVNLT